MKHLLLALLLLVTACAPETKTVCNTETSANVSIKFCHSEATI